VPTAPCSPLSAPAASLASRSSVATFLRHHLLHLFNRVL
jgi:hypothetical protein